MWKTVANIKTILGLSGISILSAYFISIKLLEKGIINTSLHLVILLVFFIVLIFLVLFLTLLSKFFIKSESNKNITQRISGKKDKQGIGISKENEQVIKIDQKIKGDENEQKIDIS